MRGRRKKYETPEALEEAVAEYFASISRMETVKYPQITKKLDEYGHPIVRMVTAKGENGKPIKQRVFYVPPDLFSLTAHIGISMATWERYGQNTDFADIVTWADELIKGWEARELRSRENKRTAGLINSIDRSERARASRQDPAQGNTPMDGLSDAQLLAMAEQVNP